MTESKTPEYVTPFLSAGVPKSTSGKWWDCEYPETTPKDADRDSVRSVAFKLFGTDEGWFFWDHQCDQCFGPLFSRVEAVQVRNGFYAFITGNTTTDDNSEL